MFIVASLRLYMIVKLDKIKMNKKSKNEKMKNKNKT